MYALHIIKKFKMKFKKIINKIKKISKYATVKCSSTVKFIGNDLRKNGKTIIYSLPYVQKVNNVVKAVKFLINKEKNEKL